MFFPFHYVLSKYIYGVCSIKSNICSCFRDFIISPIFQKSIVFSKKIEQSFLLVQKCRNIYKNVFKRKQKTVARKNKTKNPLSAWTTAVENQKLFYPVESLFPLNLRGSRLREQAGRGLKFFFSGTTRFLLISKEMGLYSYFCFLWI